MSTGSAAAIATIYSEIVVLNNRGSLLLNGGDLKGASASFSSALHALKTTVGPSSILKRYKEDEITSPLVGRLTPKIECFFSNHRQEQEGGGHQEVVRHRDASSSTNHRSSLFPFAIKQHSPWLFSSGGDFIYDQPMELYQHHDHDDVACCGGEHHHHHDDKPTTTTKVAEHRVFQIVSFSVLYNLALSTHLLAMTMLQAEEDTRQRHHDQIIMVPGDTRMKKFQTTLQQAAQLYAHAHVLLTQCSLQEDYCILHDLAIFNNHGHVLYKLGRAAEGRRNFQILFQSIILRIKTPCGSYESRSLSPRPLYFSHYNNDYVDNQSQMLDGLLSNILYYLMGSSKNAPAA